MLGGGRGHDGPSVLQRFQTGGRRGGHSGGGETQGSPSLGTYDGRREKGGREEEGGREGGRREKGGREEEGGREEKITLFKHTTPHRLRPANELRGVRYCWRVYNAGTKTEKEGGAH